MITYSSGFQTCPAHLVCLLYQTPDSGLAVSTNELMNQVSDKGDIENVQDRFENHWLIGWNIILPVFWYFIFTKVIWNI